MCPSSCEVLTVSKGGSSPVWGSQVCLLTLAHAAEHPFSRRTDSYVTTTDSSGLVSHNTISPIGARHTVSFCRNVCTIPAKISSHSLYQHEKCRYHPRRGGCPMWGGCPHGDWCTLPCLCRYACPACAPKPSFKAKVNFDLP